MSSLGEDSEAIIIIIYVYIYLAACPGVRRHANSPEQIWGQYSIKSTWSHLVKDGPRQLKQLHVDTFVSKALKKLQHCTSSGNSKLLFCLEIMAPVPTSHFARTAKILRVSSVAGSVV